MSFIVPRLLLKHLESWKKKPTRKPLILRGARQVGKTTLVRLFADTYEHSIFLNLEMEAHRLPFENISDIDELVNKLMFDAGIIQNFDVPTLLFIDEIQNCPEAIGRLRYFYEKHPGLHVIAAGSLLEHALGDVQSFPVGRVEYAVVYPFNFQEFLIAKREDAALALLDKIPIPNYAQEKLMNLFHEYALIGGMPEVVQQYVQYSDLTILKDIYESILIGYRDDARKYAKNDREERTMMHIIETLPYQAGDRIKFAGFGQSNYGSREVSEAMKSLEKARLLQLIYPITGLEPPLFPNHKKSPRLQFLDIGLINYALNIQSSLIGIHDLNRVFTGHLIEQLIGQEYQSTFLQPTFQLNFWVREKKTSTAEVDLVIQQGKYIIPVEIKTGKAGHLKSLHQFVDDAPHPYAIRLYSDKFSLHKAVTQRGKEYLLLNLPYYLGTKLDTYAAWLIQQEK